MTEVTYEITAIVEPSIVSEYEHFMTTRHIPDLMETGAFTGASFSRSSPGRYRVRYEARSRLSLDEYLHQHAARLRAHIAEVFPAGVEFSREEWDIIARFESNEPDRRSG